MGREKKQRCCWTIGKPFRHYYNLGEIYGRDRANGQNVGNADDDEEEIRHENTNVDPFNLEDENVFDNVNPSADMEPQQEGLDDVDVSFTQPNPQTSSVSQQMHAQSIASNNSRLRGKTLDEMSKNFGLMAKAVAGMAPKLDGLVNVLSTDKDLTELQSKLDGELSKMDFLTPVQVFHVTNILAQKHDLLRVFFTMSDERKASYGSLTRNIGSDERIIHTELVQSLTVQFSTLPQTLRNLKKSRASIFEVFHHKDFFFKRQQNS